MIFHREIEHKAAASAAAMAVSRVTGISIADILRPTKGPRQFSSARHLAMVISNKLAPDMSLTDIGNNFRRDHTTVIYARRAVSKSIRQDRNYARLAVQCLRDGRSILYGPVFRSRRAAPVFRTSRNKIVAQILTEA